MAIMSLEEVSLPWKSSVPGTLGSIAGLGVFDLWKKNAGISAVRNFISSTVFVYAIRLPKPRHKFS
ncbi:hypothetical protein MUK42_30012 [Musa troglodytarum]|uniref:Uncharacterized protein n=1 Tax=Musa troglodytarum TaxID=320322 RepID=A0A9E7GCY8_9LILI|nr:hypothetical protein MUK42_30012 [Musa troglodytarum]